MALRCAAGRDDHHRPSPGPGLGLGLGLGGLAAP